MVIYAVLAEQLIISLYVAAIVPSVLAIALHFSAIATYTRIRPADGSAGDLMPWGGRLSELRRG